MAWNALAGGSVSIVNVSSVYGYKPSPLGRARYATSKHAVIGLTKSAAIVYGPPDWSGVPDGK